MSVPHPIPAPPPTPPPLTQPPTSTPQPSLWETFDPSTLECNLCSFNFAALVVIPVMVICGLIQNGFALEVLQSPFLSDLPSQPIIKALLTLQSALLITGPLYMWITHVFGPLLTVTEVCPCFFLSWFHDFLIVTTSWLLVTWMMERVVSIGKLKQTWIFWRMRFLEVSIILVGVALIVTLAGGIFNGSLSGEYRDTVFSMDVCLPWLDVERIIAFPHWPRLRAVLFSLSPCLALFIFFISLVTSVYYLYFRMKRLLLDHTHYQTHLAAVRNTAQIKFVYALVCLCPIFFLTCIPIGLSLYSVCSDGSIQIFKPHQRNDGHLFQPSGQSRGIRIDFGGISIEDYPDIVSARNNATGEKERRASTALERFLLLHGKDLPSKNNSNTTENSTESTGLNIPRGGDNNNGASRTIRSSVNAEAKNKRIGRGIEPLKQTPADEKKGNVHNGSTANTSSIATLVFGANTTNSSGALGRGEASTTSKDGGGDVVDKDGGANNQTDWEGDEVDWGMNPRDRPPPLAFQNIRAICAMWMLYYCFSVLVVPVLLITEPLFRNEWLHTWCELKKSVCCFCFDCCSNTPPDRSTGGVDVELLDNSQSGPPLSGDGVPSNNSNMKTFVISNGEFMEGVGDNRRNGTSI